MCLRERERGVRCSDADDEQRICMARVLRGEYKDVCFGGWG